MKYRRLIWLFLGASFAVAAGSSPLARANEVNGYTFTNAAQEITQLY